MYSLIGSELPKYSAVRYLAICMLFLTLVACGGGGGSSPSEPDTVAAPPVTTNTNNDDSDSDGISNGTDNCPEQANANQSDADGDNAGDVCDDDDDNDGVDDLSDNCPMDANSNQADGDNDDIGDACDGFLGISPPEVITLDQFRSNINSETSLFLQVFLPENFNPTQTYPVMYIFDDIAPRIATHVNAGQNQVILVMVNGWDRLTDFTSAGAETAFSVLVNEVLPLIESQYPIDASRRTVTGWSLGGLFAGLIMLLEDPNDRKFQNYVALDGSFFVDSAFTNNLIAQLASVTNILPATLYLSGAALPGQGNDGVVQNFRDNLQAENFNQLTINYMAFPFAAHGGTIDPYTEIVVNELYPN